MFAPRNPARLAVLVTVLMLGLSTITVMAQDGAQTSPEENKAFIAEYLAAISGNEKSPELQDQYIAESDQALKDHILMFEAAFPRYELIADDMIAEGDKVVVRATFRGVHQAEFAGVPATGRQVEMPAIIIYRVADGKIVEHWLQGDVMGLMQQLQRAPMAQECLTQEGAEAFAQRFDAIFDGPSLEVIDELFAPDFVSHLPLAPELDRQGLKDYIASFYEGLPDLTEEVDEVIVAEDRVVLVVSYTGTHDGPLFGLPATGAKINFSGIGIFRFNDDCLVVENTAVIDVVGLLAQIGAFPPGQASGSTSTGEQVSDTASVIRAFYQAANAGDWEKAQSFWADDGTFVVADLVIQGGDEFGYWMQTTSFGHTSSTAVGRGWVEIRDLQADGDTVTWLALPAAGGRFRLTALVQNGKIQSMTIE